MSRPFTVVLTWPARPEELAAYNAYLAGDAVVVAPRSSDPEELRRVAADADVLMGGYVPRVMLDAARQLKMVQILHAGMAASRPGDVDLGFPLSELKRRGVLLANMHGNRVAVAEHAFAFMLAFAKRLFEAHRAVAQGEWLPFDDAHLSASLEGSTLVLVGLGHIGSEIARRAGPFGMRVVAVRRNPERPLPEGVPVERVVGVDGLYDALAEGDFVVIACPLTRETFRLFDERALRAMKPTAYLINVARAAIVDEAALYRALREGWIAGFASDVWWIYAYDEGEEQAAGFLKFGYHYGVPSRLGIHKLPNVIATGDRASFARGTLERFVYDALDNVRLLARGQRPKYVVDPDLGY